MSKFNSRQQNITMDKLWGAAQLQFYQEKKFENNIQKSDRGPAAVPNVLVEEEQAVEPVLEEKMEVDLENDANSVLGKRVLETENQTSTV